MSKKFLDSTEDLPGEMAQGTFIANEVTTVSGVFLSKKLDGADEKSSDEEAENT
jgi:hypothetical protein